MNSSADRTGSKRQPGERDKPQPGRHLLDESDIGSGEKTPGERETEEMIKSVPPLKPGSERKPDQG